MDKYLGIREAEPIDLTREIEDACLDAYNHAADKQTAMQTINHIKTKLTTAGLMRKGTIYEKYTGQKD